MARALPRDPFSLATGDAPSVRPRISVEIRRDGDEPCPDINSVPLLGGAQLERWFVVHP